MQKYLRYEENEISFLAALVKDQRKLDKTSKQMTGIFKSNQTGIVADWTKTQKVFTLMWKWIVIVERL